MEPGPGREECATSDLERGRPDLEWLALGKRAGLSFLEMNEFSLQDLVDYAEIRLGQAQGTRMADQRDIDAFYAR